MALTKNQIIPLTITGITAQGSGVGRAMEDDSAGMAVFVPFTAVGDVLECRIVKVQKQLAFGRIERLVTPSSDRLNTAGDCPVFGQCGGCAFRHVSYEAEKRYKQQRVADAFGRLAGLSVTVEPIRGSAATDIRSGWGTLRRASGFMRRAATASWSNTPVGCSPPCLRRRWKRWIAGCKRTPCPPTTKPPTPVWCGISICAMARRPGR